MKTITLQSGTYAVDDILQSFDIIEKPSSNVAFVGTCMITNRMYVQFKNGSGYMYTDVDIDVMSALPAALSIGSFISHYVVGKFTSEKISNTLIVKCEEIGDEPILILTGDITGLPKKTEAGQIFVMSAGATIEYIEPQPEQEPEF